MTTACVPAPARAGTGSLLPPVDIELVLEGSYPYVTGGVSSWVHDLIRGLPQYRFGLVHLAARQEDAREMKYVLPGNVGYLQNLYLHDPVFLPPDGAGASLENRSFYQRLFQLHKLAQSRDVTSFGPILREMTRPEALPGLRDLFFSERAYALLLALYQQRFADASFLDFFWTWRFMHLPLVQLLQSRRAPARLIHPVCTGYAGCYAAIRHLTENLPLLLTEHGIYTRERNIEITQAEWIFSEEHPDHLVRTTQGTFKRLWMSFFQAMGKWTYELSDRIITLFEGNRQAQVGLGADPARIEIVPNGIDPERFLNLRPERLPDPDAFVVGFVGRIVRIKDIRTLLMAAQAVFTRFPRVLFHLIGPLDEEPDYAAEMQALAASLSHPGQVVFHGRQKVTDWYPRLDVCVLTSVSEGQPLSILETMAAGVPTIATDIGACRELIEGRDPEDKGLGPCGVVTNLRSPAQTAQAIIDVCRHPQRYLQMVRAGKRRVTSYYRQEMVLQRYGRLYEQLLARSPVPATTGGA